jgi:hypothetical protein
MTSNGGVEIEIIRDPRPHFVLDKTPLCKRNLGSFLVNSHWEGDPMPVTYQFCWRKATECQRLADLEPAQSAARAFFIHSRDSWIVIANRLTVLGETQVATHEEAWDAIIFGQVAA